MNAAETQWFFMDAAWTSVQCAELLEQLQPGAELQFFAADHASPSDPGAYIRVQWPRQDEWLRKAANHGWSTDWTRVTLEALRVELYRNRHAQPSEVPLSAALVQATEGEK